MFEYSTEIPTIVRFRLSRILFFFLYKSLPTKDEHWVVGRGKAANALNPPGPHLWLMSITRVKVPFSGSLQGSIRVSIKFLEGYRMGSSLK